MECVVCVWGGVAGVGGEWVTGLGLGFTNSGGTWGNWDMCLSFGCGGVGGVRGEWVGGLGLGGWCGAIYVCVVSLCVYRRSIYLYIVLGGFLRILGAPSVLSCCTLLISASQLICVCGRYRKSGHVCVMLSDLDLSRHHPLL